MPDRPRNLEVTVDGSARWRKIYAGVVIRDSDTKEVLEAKHFSFGRGTNNRAEYLALIIGCQTASRFQRKRIVFYTDSQLVFRQINGEYQVRKKELRSLHRTVLNHLKTMRAVLRWHRRDEGDGPIADRLASAQYKETIHEITGRVGQGRAGGDAQGEIEGERIYAGRGDHNPVENEAVAARCN